MLASVALAKLALHLPRNTWSPGSTAGRRGPPSNATTACPTGWGWRSPCAAGSRCRSASS